MADAIKNMYNKNYLQKLATDMQSAYAAFPMDDFIASVMDESWESLELKARMRQITINLGKFLPQNYAEAIAIIDKVIVNHGTWLDGFCLYFPDFVELYGQENAHWELSMQALARYTIHASAEFAVRPFIINQQERMMAQMLAWAKSDNAHLRRLASEGCRPALPWAQVLPAFKKNPAPIIPILELLKTDPDLYVRKSVANNLNDISKTHPELVVDIAKQWYGNNEHTNWIVKHACRTLLKKANPQALAIFGFENANDITVSDFIVNTKEIKIGESLMFSFAICVNDTQQKSSKVRLEYAIDFVKANGKQSRKIFQISEINMKTNEVKRYEKNHAFADLSTRKHYAGTHAVTLITNGVAHERHEFEVLPAK